MFEGIFLGVQTLFSMENLLYVFLGCFIGTIIGMLPGLGPITAIALMIPVTYGLSPETGMILMAGVYYGAIFGGSTSAILINAPGVAGTVASAFDGYPLARQGKAGKALAIAAWSSFIGGTIAVVLLMLTAPILAKFAGNFKSADYALLMILGLTAISAFASKGLFLKAMIMVVVGLMISSVGIDPLSGAKRYTFGESNLLDGVDFLLLAMALFALSEALVTVLKKGSETQASLKGSDLKNLTSQSLSKKEIKDIAPSVGRSSVFGFIVGVLPGAGATIASFLAYGAERSLSKNKKEFGKGSLRGLAAPESANNAACTGSFVPLLTLGIPGSGTTAIMLGALLAYGLQPGPLLIEETPHVFWSIILSMYLGNIVLLFLNLPLIPYISRLLAIPRQFLNVGIIFFAMIGVYLVTFNLFDIYILLLISIFAVFLRFFDFPLPPLILSFILGSMLETNLRRALMISDGSLAFLWEEPLTLCLALIIGAMLAFPVIRLVLQRKTQKSAS